MVHIVWIIGALIGIWGIVTVILPTWMKAVVQFIVKKRIIYLVAAVKVTCGILFLIFARECHISWLILIMGLLTAGGSLLFCALPSAKIQAWMQWWQGQPLWLYRVWGILATALGGLIMYAGVPKAEPVAGCFLFNSFLT